MSQDNAKEAAQSGSFDPLELSKQLDGESLSWKKSEKLPSAASNTDKESTETTERKNPSMPETKSTPGMAGVNKANPLSEIESAASKVDPAEVEALANQLAARDRVKDHTFLSKEEIAARAERSKDRKLVPNIQIEKEAKKEKGPKKTKNDGMIPTVATGKDAFFRKRKTTKGFGSRLLSVLLISSGAVLLSGNITLMGLLYYGHSEQIHALIHTVLEGKEPTGISSALEPKETKVTQPEAEELHEFPPFYLSDPESKVEATTIVGENNQRADTTQKGYEPKADTTTAPSQKHKQEPTYEWLDQAKDVVTNSWEQLTLTAKKAWQAVVVFSEPAFPSALAPLEYEQKKAQTEATKPVVTETNSKTDATNQEALKNNSAKGFDQTDPSFATVASIDDTTKSASTDALEASPSLAVQAKQEAIKEAEREHTAKGCSIANNIDQRLFATVEEKLSKRSVDTSVVRKHEMVTSYLVYLPKELASSDKQIDVLKSKGVKDSHKIRVAGPLNGVLSLGMFSTETSAKKQQQILEQKGIAGTKVGPRTTISVLDVKLTGDSSQLEVAKGILATSSQRISFSSCQSNIAKKEGSIELSSR